jgi:hypothetical protein
VIKSRRIRLAGYVACMGEREGAYMVFVEEPEGGRLLGRPKPRWENNIKMGFFFTVSAWGSLGFGMKY